MTIPYKGKPDLSRHSKCPGYYRSYRYSFARLSKEAAQHPARWRRYYTVFEHSAIVVSGGWSVFKTKCMSEMQIGCGARCQIYCHLSALMWNHCCPQNHRPTSYGLGCWHSNSQAANALNLQYSNCQCHFQNYPGTAGQLPDLVRTPAHPG